MKRLVLLCAALAATGCYTMKFVHGNRLPEPGAPRERWVHTFFGGVWQPGGPVDLDAVCPQGVASIEQEVSAGNWAVSQIAGVAVSAGAAVQFPQAAPVAYLLVGRHLDVWDPVTVRVVCARGAVVSRRIAVFKLEARGGISPDTAALFTDSLVDALRHSPGTTVLGDADIAAALGLERQKQLLGCTDDKACLTEIGGALGVDRLIHGSVGRVGGSLVVNITSIDPRTATAVASVSERLKSESDEAFLDALPGIAAELLMESMAPGK